MTQVASTSPARSAQTAASLQEDIRAIQSRLEDAIIQRTQLEQRRGATDIPSERARLTSELVRVNSQIGQLRAELEGLNAQARLAGPRATTKASPARVPPVQVITTTSGTGIAPRPPINEDVILGGLAIVFVLAPLAFAIAWRVIRGPKNQATRVELAESNERLRRIEQAVDTIAVEVERVTENQRFLTKALASEQKVRQEL